MLRNDHILLQSSSPQSLIYPTSASTLIAWYHRLPSCDHSHPHPLLSVPPFFPIRTALIPTASTAALLFPPLCSAATPLSPPPTAPAAPSTSQPAPPSSHTSDAASTRRSAGQRHRPRQARSQQHMSRNVTPTPQLQRHQGAPHPPTTNPRRLLPPLQMIQGEKEPVERCHLSLLALSRSCLWLLPLLCCSS